MPVSAVLARNATEVRRNFGEFLDEVLHGRPQTITRYDDVVIALSLRHLKALLEHISFTMEYEKESDMSVLVQFLSCHCVRMLAALKN